MDKAFVKLINKNTSIVKLLANYCDVLLRKSNKKVGKDNLENELNNITRIINYIDDKDAFLMLYTRMFARRLINNVTVSDNNETFMISKLEEICGRVYTYKLRRMLEDMEVSKDLNDKFKTHLDSSQEAVDIDFSVKVVSSGIWPYHQSNQSSIPWELERHIKQFTVFYHSQYNGRKLYWMLNQSQGEIVTDCFQTQHILQVSTLQMSVLLAFNSKDRWTLDTLASTTHIDMELLRQVVRTLLEFRLLSGPNPETVDIEEEAPGSTMVSLNYGYTDRKTRVNINIPVKKGQSYKKDMRAHKYDKERKHMIEAVIVKIMKVRKTLKHDQLLTEVLDQVKTRFHPSVVMVRECIQFLIDKEYIAKDYSQEDSYTYIP